ncbi:MAG: PA2169 family four-helix-bundle protein [Chthoniobacterales bacterium]|jgi:uncharacterized protein (TIGR02284 family)
MAQQKETISTINDLIETLKDGQEGFRQAAEAVEDRELKTLFNECSLQRARFVGELQSEAVTLGESKPEDSGSTAGALHRSWINLKGAIAKHDDHAILEECERGEDSAVHEYKEALDDEDLTSPVREIISRQYEKVKSVHDRIKHLRDATAS